MKFEERISRYPDRRKLIKLDNYGNVIDEPIIVDIVRDDSIEGVEKQGTPLTAERMNQGNWRKDKTLSFKKLQEGEQAPSSSIDSTQIFTSPDGRTWLLAPGHMKTPVEIGAGFEGQSAAGLVNSLTSTSTTDALTANMGRLLNEEKLSKETMATSTVSGLLRIRFSPETGTLFIRTDGLNA